MPGPPHVHRVSSECNHLGVLSGISQNVQGPDPRRFDDAYAKGNCFIPHLIVYKMNEGRCLCGFE